MTSPVFALYLTCLFLGKTAQTTALKFSSSVRQDSSFISANVGDSVSLRCSYEGDVATKLYWYKQTLGQKPRLISTFYTFDSNGTFYNEFNNNPRFTLDTENSKNHLKITDLHISDSATYYCISSYLNKLEFLEGTTLSVKGSGLNIQALVRQSASESIQPGGSVTLNCAVHTGTCDDGEHSVYWFKNSEESQPGVIYTHGGRNNQCERNNNTQTHTCVYNLPLKSLDLSHTGTYYCAVAACGQILFGNGTKLDVGCRLCCLGVFLEWSFGVHHHPQCFTGFLSVQDEEKQLTICRVSSNIFSFLHNKWRGLPTHRQPALCCFKCEPAQQIKKSEEQHQE
ncbi:immunoglobulin kappa light chain-like isoform X2 [Thunnus maccoyii]|uniref:immunoglobulin kappa light chain-like isoform X2 n=1 Tax=Thunnus maccoyii TaxID=8240 RepID=UPI001C4BFA0D|nr:immunoglobulin kappa light chain-like isoform X2 [Thunnus maccoyii]